MKDIQEFPGRQLTVDTCIVRVLHNSVSNVYACMLESLLPAPIPIEGIRCFLILMASGFLCHPMFTARSPNQRRSIYLPGCLWSRIRPINRRPTYPFSNSSTHHPTHPRVRTLLFPCPHSTVLSTVQLGVASFSSST